MTTYPVDFEAKAQAAPGTDKSWTIESGSHAVECAVPPEFGGTGGGFSPEDLFAQALTNCFMATFKVYAQASKVGFGQIGVKSLLSVDKNSEGQPIMKLCHLDIQVTGADRPDRVETLVQKALKSGFILNSVTTEITHRLSFA